jgi:hypothetical protein
MDRVKYMRGGSSGNSNGVSLGADTLDALNSQPPKHGDNWGRWKLNGHGDHWSLDLGSYWISLQNITSNAQMNDWIFQLASKTWVTAEDLGNLVLAFEDIFSPQATLCGMGVDKPLPSDYVTGTLGKPLGEGPAEKDSASEGSELEDSESE